jgi:TRAP-type C4-dicarboxylate transport system permease small subunit
MGRETLRGLLIVLGIAIIATVFSETSARIASALFGAVGLIFICLMWYFGYRWYRENRMAISLMPDRQRSILYAGMGAVTVSAALYSLSQFGLVALGAFGVPVLIAFFAGLFGMFYAWQESKRYTL